MKPIRWWLAAWLAVVAAVVPGLRGQQPIPPRVGYVYPAGGRQGTTVQVVLGGQFLDGVWHAVVSGEGVTARVVEHDRPLTPRQVNEARDRLDALQKQAADPGVQRQILELRRQIADTLRRNRNPVLSEMVTVELTIAGDAPPGDRHIRVATPAGLSNPLVLAVGQLPEVREEDGGAAREGTLVTLPVTVNGRLVPGSDLPAGLLQQRPAGSYTPGDVDRYRFGARAGQQLVMAVSARSLRPYLADAVPGWLQATLTLFDRHGRELASNDDFRFHPDPLLAYRVPADGEYVLEIRDALHRGREDFVYRIAIGELPYVTGVYPLGGPAGRTTEVTVSGWNLPSAVVTVDQDGRHAGTYPFAVRAGAVLSNVVPFAADALPEVIEREPNGAGAEAQAIAPPVVVNGRIDRPGDLDVYRFTGRAGDAIVAEVVARRLESPLDSVLELTDASGRRLDWNDDHHDPRAGLVTHHADSRVTATLPADGEYVLRLGDAQGHGGSEYAYRLRVGPPRPDFELRVTPSAINANAGSTTLLTAHVMRTDGFDGDVTLALTGAPGGAMLSGGVVPAGQAQVRFTLTAPPFPARDPYALRIEGRAVIDGRTVVREAVPADDMMQAFIYRHVVPAGALTLSVTGRGARGRGAAPLFVPRLLRIPAGATARVRVPLPPLQGIEHLDVELSDPPAGISLGEVRAGQGGVEFVVEADGAKAAAGLRGNLIVALSGERSAPAGAQGQAARRRVLLGLLPAIPFEIVRP